MSAPKGTSSNRHGRPLRADARRNRERILEAAQELFAGPEGLSVPLDEIAEHAGVGAGTVHRHFPTKEALIAAVAVSRIQQVVTLATSLATADDPGAALRQQLSVMLAEGDQSAPLKSALAGTDFNIRTAAPDAAGELRDAVNVLLRRAQKAERDPPRDRHRRPYGRPRRHFPCHPVHRRAIRLKAREAPRRNVLRQPGTTPIHEHPASRINRIELIGDRRGLDGRPC